MNKGCLLSQMSSYFENVFSKYQCGLKEGVSAQYCLIYMIQKCKIALDNGKIFTALLTYLPKAFDCLPLKFIIGKLNAYGFSLSSSELIHSCSPNQKQRTRINSAYSSCEEIIFDLPQGFIIGQFLLKNFIHDLCSILSNIAFTNYANDTTSYVLGDGLKEVIDSFKNALADLFCWFASNQTNPNLDKCHLIAGCDNETSICVNNYSIRNNKCEKILVLKIAHKL